MESWKIELYAPYLVHHGIEGQKWGVKHGPPYPLTFEKLSKEEKKNMTLRERQNYKSIAKNEKYLGKQYEKENKKLQKTLEKKAKHVIFDLPLNKQTKKYQKLEEKANKHKELIKALELQMDNLAKRPTEVYKQRIKDAFVMSSAVSSAATIGSMFVTAAMTGGTVWLPSVVAFPLVTSSAADERSVTGMGKKEREAYIKAVKTGKDYVDSWYISKDKKAKEGGSK